MKKLLVQKEQWIAYKREEAEDIVNTAKENDEMNMHKITEKFNKNGVYFLVDIQYHYGTPKEVMETTPPEKDIAPDGQMSIEDVDKSDEATGEEEAV
ncbi:MAG: hypothetical protein ABS960_00760 [Solibacillus isronensis]